MADSSKDGAAQSAAADAIIRELVSYAVLFAVSYAVLNRDVVARLWARFTARPLTAAEAYAERLVAELRRDIADYEHAGGEPC
jgi:hypothetical protein